MDLNYTGHGLSEYMIYDTKSNSWDMNECKNKTSSGQRCVKMDCHLKVSNNPRQRGFRVLMKTILQVCNFTQSTFYKTLGYFKQALPVEFLQVLAQHQGSCSFTGNETTAMTNGINWLPQKCTQTQVQDGSSYLYFDLKPKSGGDLDVALYTDAQCNVEYTGTATTAQKVLTSYYGYDVDLKNDLASINSALNHFKVCTPCRTFDLNYQANANSNANAQGNGDPNNLNFVCVDSTGAEDVNQCRYFAKTTTIQTASISEVTTASRQGTIMNTNSSAQDTMSWWQKWGFLFMSIVVFVLGLLSFCSVAVKRKRVSSVRSEPLMAKQ